MAFTEQRISKLSFERIQILIPKNSDFDPQENWVSIAPLKAWSHVLVKGLFKWCQVFLIAKDSGNDVQILDNDIQDAMT